MNPVSPLGAPAIDSLGPKKVTPEKLKSAAQQFEGLMMHQLLKSAAGEDGGWLGTGEEDSAGLQAMDMAQEQFAMALSARGGLGLAKFVIPQLSAGGGVPAKENAIQGAK